jgi:hypothetical protein
MVYPWIPIIEAAVRIVRKRSIGFWVSSIMQVLSQEPVGRRINLLQIRLDGPYSAAFLGNRTTSALQNRQNLSSPSQIFALIS